MVDFEAMSEQDAGGKPRPIIQLFGAHPVENIASMDVYRESLLREISPDDDQFEIRCWPEAGSWSAKSDHGSSGGPFSRIVRALKKYPGYARRVRNCPQDTALVHFLDHSLGYLRDDVPQGLKTVFTVHDLIPLSFPGELSRGQRKRFQRSVADIFCADAVIAVSEFTKSEVIQKLEIDPERVHVLPNGVSCPDLESIGDSAAVDRLRDRGAEAVLLSVGTTLQRKNLDLLPQALKVATEGSGKKLGLLRIGDFLSRNLVERITDVIGEGHLIELGRVEQSTLWSAYRATDALVFPSLYEGFGLPVLEALACGTAVACSDSTSLPEVGGEVVEYFDPRDFEAAGAAVLRAIEQAHDPASRSARIAHATGFCWRQHWIGCQQVYRNVLG